MMNLRGKQLYDKQIEYFQMKAEGLDSKEIRKLQKKAER